MHDQQQGASGSISSLLALTAVAGLWLASGSYNVSSERIGAHGRESGVVEIGQGIGFREAAPETRSQDDPPAGGWVMGEGRGVADR